MSFKLLVGGYTAVITALSFTFNGAGAGTGSLSILSQSPAGSNPSWIEVNPTNPSVLYALQENDVGQILSFTIDSTTGQLTQAGSVATNGSGPAHFAVSQSGFEILVANVCRDGAFVRIGWANGRTY